MKPIQVVGIPRKLTQNFKIKLLVLLVLILGAIVIHQAHHHKTKITNSIRHYVPEHYQKLFEIREKVERVPFFDDPNTNRERIKIDWHDYAFMKYEASRVGLGEQGKEVLLNPIDKILQDAMYHANGYDAYMSDRVSLNRSLPDVRHPDCKLKKYLAELPTVSVVVPFWNEQFSTVMRTAVSCILRAPKHLLLEVILVDDFSDQGFTWNELNDFAIEHFKGKIKVIRFTERKGLMAARQAGAKAAKGEVLLFIDAHTEANVNWLPPLVEPIAENYRVCTVPFVDSVDVKTYKYIASDSGRRGTFNWGFAYKRIPVLPEDLLHPIEPFKSPIMNGGLFAISAKFFWELGGYDEGLDIWGGEQFEISFKIWQCHGAIYDVPCSHFGHLFRYGGKPFPNPRSYDFYTRNVKRVAEVWMDEYKEVAYKKNPTAFAKVDAGDLTKQHALRKNLQCHSFKWYLDNVAIEVLELFPPGGRPAFASGAIRSVSNPTLCVDTLGTSEKPIELYPCGGNMTHPNWNQRFELSHFRDIRQNEETCMDHPTSTHGAPIIMGGCHESQGNQFWRYNPATKMLTKDSTNLHCMDCDPVDKKVFLSKCNVTNLNQKWEWGFVNRTMTDNWEEYGKELIL